MNSSKSAFAYYAFKETFFTYFQYETHHLSDQSILNNTTNANATRRSNENHNDLSLLDEHQPFRCKIPARCLLSIFKNINSLEKNVEKCIIAVKHLPISNDTAAKVYDYDTTMTTKKFNKNGQEQLYDVKFVVTMFSKFGMRKIFLLSISDCESLQATFSTENCTNRLSISARYLHETINSFNGDTEEVSFVLESNKLNIKNYVEPESNFQKNFIFNKYNNK